MFLVIITMQNPTHLSWRFQTYFSRYIPICQYFSFGDSGTEFINMSASVFTFHSHSIQNQTPSREWNWKISGILLFYADVIPGSCTLPNFGADPRNFLERIMDKTSAAIAPNVKGISILPS